jgi:hypothetical protein
MLVLLRNHTTGLYYCGSDLWTNDPRTACHFRFVDFATLFALDHKLDSADVILDYQSPECQLSLPVREDWLPDTIDLVQWTARSLETVEP